MFKCIVCNENLSASSSLVNLSETHKAHLACFFEGVPNEFKGIKRSDFIEKHRLKLIQDFDNKKMTV